ncbi:Hypothetical predicted protein [Podarcis lilfordi]|uniref:Uncharacterized protein n=1 Tax=Podarcis lilfordi TaxID=74358 RepID=A0AA35PMZ5_9SAUR|nr:Hypothetical predicted protein [Podarcis lilfordi]
MGANLKMQHPYLESPDVMIKDKDDRQEPIPPGSLPERQRPFQLLQLGSGPKLSSGAFRLSQSASFPHKLLHSFWLLRNSLTNHSHHTMDYERGFPNILTRVALLPLMLS